MANVGLLPASGNAHRLNGIPKFLLPIGKGSLLTWHIEQMLEVCDEVRVSTSKLWMPILTKIKLPFEVTFYEIEPSTCSNALLVMSSNDSLVIGLPDTYVKGLSENMYKNLVDVNADVVVASFNCPSNLQGSVGQLLLDKKRNILDVKEKVKGCKYPDMWGAMVINNAVIDGSLEYPSHQIMDWIKEGKSVKTVDVKGTYIDAGTFAGLKQLYSD